MIIRDPAQLPYRQEFSVENLRKILDSIMDCGILKGAVAMLLCINDFFFNPDGHNLVTYVIVMVSLDTLTGLLKAIYSHTVSSPGFFRFALKLIVYFILLMASSLLDKVIPVGGFLSALSTMGAYLCLTEMISILENISALGYTIPYKLLNALKTMQAGKPKSSTGPSNPSSKESL